MRPKKHEKKHPKNVQEGQLVVCGKGDISIPLKDMPYRIEVFFKKKRGHHAPCNPHHHKHPDILFWEVRRQYHRHHFHYRLVVRWRVEDIREIGWVAYY